MSKWLVTYHVDATGTIVVDAESEAEAREIADENFFADCENTEIGDAVNIVDCQPITG